MLFSLILAALVTVSPGETPSGAAAGEIAAAIQADILIK